MTTTATRTTGTRTTGTELSGTNTTTGSEHHLHGTDSTGMPAKLTRIGAGLILLLGALTAIGPFTIDLYLAAFPQITSDMGTQPAAVQLTITATLAGLAARPIADRVHLRRDRSAQTAARRAGALHRGVDRHRVRHLGRGADGAAVRPGSGRVRRHGAVDGDRARPVRGHPGRQGAGQADAGGRRRAEHRAVDRRPVPAARDPGGTCSSRWPLFGVRAAGAGVLPAAGVAAGAAPAVRRGRRRALGPTARCCATRCSWDWPC